MARKIERVIVDTNLWISYLIGKDFRVLDAAILSGKIKLIFSPESLTEFLEVVQRPKFRRYFSNVHVAQLLDLFDVYGEIIEVSSTVVLSRDPNDDFLLALAKDSAADFLITGDKDLLDLGSIGKTEIVSVTDYLSRH